MNEPQSSRKWIIFALILLAPSLYLWLPYSTRMWQTGHYQYFPLVFLVVGALLWQRRFAITENRTAASNAILIAGAGLTMMLSLAGLLLHSGLLGLLATLLAVLLLVYGTLGRTGVWAALPVLALLLFTIPLPLNYDRILVFEMQFFASQLSSWLLDGIGLVHFRNGVVLMTEKSQYLTEEACSGVRSLFSTLAIVAIVSVVLRHRPIRFVVNMVQAVFWVVVGNAIRVTAVVYVADHYTDRVAKGTGHEIVGMAVFVFILMMVYSTDVLIGLIVRRYSFPLGAGDDDDAGPPVTRPLVFNEFRLGTVSLVALGIMSVLITVVSLRVGYVQRNRLYEIGLENLAKLAPPDASELPAELLGWQLQGFEHIERQTSFLQAEDSYIWTYRKDAVVARVSLDGPWAGWHDLAVCYRGLGWKTNPDYFVGIEGEYGLQQTGNLRHSEISMSRDEDSGYVLFSSVDRVGGEVLPEWRSAGDVAESLPTVMLRQATATLGFDLDTQLAMTGNRLPATTIQLAAMSSSELTDADIEELRALFFATRERLVQTRRFRE